MRTSGEPGLELVASDCARSAASPAPGMSSRRFDTIWQPLQTPSVKVSCRRRSASKWPRAERSSSIDFAHPCARPEDVPVGEAAARRQAAEVARSRAASMSRHVNVDGLEAGAVKRRSHLDVSVDPLLAKDGHPRPSATRNEWGRHVVLRSNVSFGR